MTNNHEQPTPASTGTEQPLPPAGPGLDRLVAAKLGWHKESGLWFNRGGLRQQTVREFKPSTTWEKAGLLLRLLHSMGIEYKIGSTLPEGGVYATLSLPVVPGAYKNYHAESDTAPHAICLAFLALPDEVTR